MGARPEKQETPESKECLFCGYYGSPDDYLRKEEPAQKQNTCRSCWNCKHFYEDKFCGYSACMCKIHGSLDVDQHERHPDVTGKTCKDYARKEEEKL